MPGSSSQSAPVDRIARVNEILKREIADLIEKRGLNEGGCLISVTKVNCSSCLKNAAVYISLLGGKPEDEARVLKVLMRCRPEIQRGVAKHIVLKYTPVLHFIFDRSIRDGDRVLDIIRELEEDDASK